MSKESRQKKQGRGIFHPEHRMNRNSLNAYRSEATKLAHLRHRERVLAFLAKFSEESFSRLKLTNILLIRETSLCPVLKALKDANLIAVEVKRDSESDSEFEVEHYQHPEKRKESHQATLF